MASGARTQHWQPTTATETGGYWESVSQYPPIAQEERMIETSLFQQNIIPASPKLMEVVKIKPQLASRLNAEWHSRLPQIHWSNIVRNRNYICYGAMFDWRYFAVAIWSSPVNQSFDFDTVLELRRLAISPDAPKFTATWMLGKMVKLLRVDLPSIARLISYQDTEAHKGTIYKAANWFVAGDVKYRAWDKTRERSKPQSTADKIRWEYMLK